MPRCIECGFCESNCPSRDVTITPRQRIAVYKELHRLNTLPDPSAIEQQRWVTDPLILQLSDFHF